MTVTDSGNDLMHYEVSVDVSWGSCFPPSPKTGIRRAILEARHMTPVPFRLHCPPVGAPFPVWGHMPMPEKDEKGPLTCWLLAGNEGADKNMEASIEGVGFLRFWAWQKRNYYMLGDKP